MKEMQDYIKKYGSVVGDKILKVDCFLNHQIDPQLMMALGKEWKKRFEGKEITKVLTIEASGIALGVMLAYVLEVPMVFAKKKKPSTMSGIYHTKVFSFTKQTEYDVIVSEELLEAGDKVLLLDDFLATGNAIFGLEEICRQAGAEVVGLGIAIEKGFQEGGKKLRAKGLQVESLAIVDSLKNGEIKFR